MAGPAVHRGVIPASERDLTGLPAPRYRACAVYLLVLTLLFIQPLENLLMYAARSDLHSHALLVPMIAGYLLYARRASLPRDRRSSIPGTVIASAVGLGALAAGSGWRATLSLNDQTALAALAFVSLVIAGALAFLGRKWTAAAMFPMAFLLFLIPLPDAIVNAFEAGSSLASAAAAGLYFDMAGIPVVHHGTVFELPGIVLQVGQECSGIRSSWVLFITSVLASHLFLKSPWRRMALVALVIPLGVLRNGFRVFVIGVLCVRIGPHMIDSVIHRSGGPLFFALSLIPLFLALWWLRRSERRVPQW